MTKEKWVLVTGATSGIGLATAVLLALKGYQVIATGRTEETLLKLQKAADEANTTIRRVKVDVTCAASIANMQSEVLAMTNGYGVDVLVNNAGYAEGGAIEEIPLERLRKQFETNVIGLVAMTQAFLPLMRERKHGRVINISSVVGKISIPLLGAYTATKHAVEAISDALRIELKNTGIDVVSIRPGSISTNFGSTVAQSVKSWSSSESAYRASYDKFIRQRTSERGVSPVVIAQVVERAVRASRPKAIYSSPFLTSSIVPILKAVLPNRLLNYVLYKAVME